jgi:hypothetical protein
MSSSQEIVGISLTHARVRPRGRIVELGFKDRSGSRITLALPHQALGMLLMTLPQLIDMSLWQRTGDLSLRHVYPVGNWQVEMAPRREQHEIIGGARHRSARFCSVPATACIASAAAGH